jgi:hypothetical protein
MPANESHLPGYPCLYKAVCKNCNKVAIDDRPSLCVHIKCVHYTICPLCHENRTLRDTDQGVMCGQCLTKKPNLAKAVLAKEEAARAGTATISGATAEPRQITVTKPGTPPPELNEEEKRHYKERWEDFKGYYRNPAAYFTCHMIILEEITLGYVEGRILASRGNLNTEWNEIKSISIATLEKLNKQLPAKESEDLLDDEKSLAMIYDTYVNEKKIRYANGVARLLTPEALALAPAMHFPIDATKLLQRCGFTPMDIEDVLQRVEMPPEHYTAAQVLEYFGFRLREEYAQPIASPLSESQILDDEERLV